MIYFFIALGGVLGAISRFFISNKLNKQLPLGTMLVNVIGSFLLGYFIGLGMKDQMYAFLGSGFCGAFTTFSTFQLETFQLFKNDRKWTALFYLFITYLIGLISVFGGFLLA